MIILNIFQVPDSKKPRCFMCTFAFHVFEGKTLIKIAGFFREAETCKLIVQQ